MKKPSWNGSFVMPPSSQPLSFVDRGIIRPTSPDEDLEISGVRVEPRGLPLPKYAPKPLKKPNPIDEYVRIIDGRRHLVLPGEAPIEISYVPHRGPQSVYPTAIPVPNLSKKSRGRAVPTKGSGGRTGRTYTCKVEECQKVFGRYEHLKRHIRSLHTHEKPYLCGLPFCDKTFARRDNLMQHEKKHKHYQAYFDCTKDHDGVLVPDSRVIKANANLARQLISEGKELPPPLLDAIAKEEQMLAAAAAEAAPPVPILPPPVVDMQRVSFAEGSALDYAILENPEANGLVPF